MNKKFTALAAGIPAIMLIISVTAFIINTRIAEGKPVIYSLEPQVVSVGETLVIRGENFGDSKNSSSLFISTHDLLSRSIHSWSDEEIVITVPEKATSGLLTVRTDRGLSEPEVLVLDDSVPYIGTGAYIPGLPFIETIDPSFGGAGSVVTVKGDNFGNRKNNSSILFSSFLSDEKDKIDGDTVLVNFLQVSESEIISWDNDEIRFYLPDFVTTGDAYIKTEKGYSNAVYFEQSLVNSKVKLGDKKTYMIKNTISLSFSDDNEGGKINLWIMSPEETLYQRNIVNLPDNEFKSTRPCNSVNLYRIDREDVFEELSLYQNTIVDVYDRSYAVDDSEIGSAYNTGSPLYLEYTESTDLLPATAERVAGVSRSVTRRKNTSISKARAIYDYVLARITWSAEVEERSPVMVIDTMIGDSEAYSRLFVSLARSSGIPSRPVTGLLVDAEGAAIPHWWVEFYLQGFGWFAADPALADGMPGPVERENPVEYYWGNIDNHHIAFSRGEKELPVLFPDGIVRKEIDHALVTHNVEIDSAIIDLHLDRSDVKITAIY